jgi:hypothetical protein
LLLCAAATLQAQEASMRLDTNAIPLGGQVRLHLEFALPGGWSPQLTPVNWPAQSDTLSGTIEAIAYLAIDTVRKEEAITKLTQAIVITSFDTGFVVIPPLTVMFGSEPYETNPLLLHVLAPKLDEDGIRDLKPIYEVSYTFFDRLLDHASYFLVGLVFIIALVVARTLFKRRLRKPDHQAVQAETLLSPHEEALNALAMVEKKGLWQNGNHKAYHTELSEILRRYVGRRYGVQTLERTTRELISDLKLSGLAIDELNRLRATLELADMVKFAKYRPVVDENERVLINAYSFVKSTASIPNSDE